MKARPKRQVEEGNMKIGLSQRGAFCLSSCIFGVVDQVTCRLKCILPHLALLIRLLVG